MPRPALRRRYPQPPSPKRRGIPSSPAARADLERKLAHKPVGEKPADSDDSDRLVFKTSNLKKKRSAPTTEIYCSGGVAKGDQPNAYPTRAERRRKLERETREIVSQSRSRDASPDAGKARKTQGTAPSTSPVATVETQLQSTSRAATTLVADVESHPAVTPKASIFSGLKPRRRQNSILSQLANGDSSSIGSHDEAAFLPHDKSPPSLSKPLSTPPSIVSPNNNDSATRKRKLGSDESVPLTTKRRAARRNGELNPHVENDAPEIELPPMPSSALRRPTRKGMSAEDMDNIMAPPRSDSSDSSPKKAPTSVKPTKKAAKPVVLSTEQLQSLMPTKRRQTTRQKNQRDQFDIPSDTSNTADGNPQSDAENDSSFLPRSRRTRKGRPTKTAKATKSSKRPTLSATPLRPTRNRSTKSPSQRPFLDVRGSALKGKGNEHKSYGGSHQGAGGKENNSESTGVDVGDVDAMQVLSPASTNKMVTKATTHGKWAEIDAWDMDFEEVEVITGSSSPMRR